jgi:glycosyltransferase involved in cell wall biosynthesis
MDSPDRIAFLIPEYPGQTHVFFHREMQALARCGVQAHVISTRKPPAALIAHGWSARAIAETTYLFPPRPRLFFAGLGELLRAGPRRWWRCIRTAAVGDGSIWARFQRSLLIPFAGMVAATLRRQAFPHLHAHSCARAADLALFTHLLTGRPYSITLHGPLRDYGPNQKQKWRHAAFAFVITQRLLAEVKTELAGYLPPVIAIAPMGADLGLFKRIKAYVPWDGKGRARLFTCGRLNPCKGHDDLIRAAARLRGQGIDVTVRIAGQSDSGRPDYRNELADLAKTIGVADRVEFLGAIPEEFVRAELEQAHVFVLASLEEPLGVAIMEAMAMEMPIVVTGAGGVPELVHDGIDGLLVPQRDPDRLAARIAEVLRDADLARRLSAASRATIATGFHSGISADRLVEQVAALR